MTTQTRQRTTFDTALISALTDQAVACQPLAVRVTCVRATEPAQVLATCEVWTSTDSGWYRHREIRVTGWPVWDDVVWAVLGAGRRVPRTVGGGARWRVLGDGTIYVLDVLR